MRIACVFICDRIADLQRLTRTFFQASCLIACFPAHAEPIDEILVTAVRRAVVEDQPRTRILDVSQDGLRIEAPDYDLPKQKPAGQLRVAVLGSSAIQHPWTRGFAAPGFPG